MMRRNTARLASGPQANPFDKTLRATLKADGGDKVYYQINKLDNYATLPFSVRVLLESAVRNCDEFDITQKSVENILNWKTNATKQIEIPFKPARVILQDFTGVPCVVDLAAMRDAMVDLGGDPSKINPQIPVDLVIDHSVQVDVAGSPDALQKNAELEMQRNRERFAFLKWGSTAFENLKIVPPGSGIVHQVNLEHIANVTFNRNGYLYPDSVVGTDSHTTMINGAGVLGWGVGGIEAEAAMLGQSLSLVLPKVVGYKLTGKLREGVTATDLVLTCTRNLRKLGVVGKFVEYYGEGYKTLSLADRATLANMAPEYGATMGYCPIDQETLNYLRTTGRTEEHLARIETYAKAAGLWATGDEQIQYTENLELDLSTVEPCLSGPKRPQDHVTVRGMKADFNACMNAKQGFKGFGIPQNEHGKSVKYTLNGQECEMHHGSLVIAAITSCTNTSNPSVLMAAGLVAKKAVEKGLTVSPSVKTSLSPGSHVVTRYLESAGLQSYLDKIGFQTTGYGCMTCIGNSGEIAPEVSKTIADNNLVATAVLSGNRNFEARVHPQTAGNYLASPPLVVAYALAGRVDIDFETEPIAPGVFLRDIWPSNAEVKEAVAQHVNKEFFESVYSTLLTDNEAWNKLEAPKGARYQWDEKSTYIHSPPYFAGMKKAPDARGAIKDAACVLYLGDSVTTDHISPAGNIAKNSPAALFLEGNGVARADFNTYGSRRGNDLIMMRGTFANTRLGNKLVGEGQTGPWTIHHPTGDKLPVFDACMRYKEAGTPTIVLAGKEYGSGSSRDWAAKGPFLQGIKVVVAESYERIHRSNLVGMGIIPLQFKDGASAASLGLTGKETFQFDIPAELTPGQDITVTADGKSFTTTLRIDTAVEVKFFEHGGILNYVLRGKLQA
eukprot:CAMPEP_0174832676 /NCGR_PEP_ID=MMETSP1114-20130205/3795_1 /TAXON_ID=312471 /ORGANISM="Neobodo designis, Strain CCAP 1951/1" /LENGTH=895 /DNA_ID=CAMNT_0016066539 /DNA_START=36 /DNA_END=2723 /DNA_ORIENTATION=-